MSISNHDRDILRALGAQVAEITALPVQQEKIALWKALNGLNPVRPMVMIDQVCWHEMDVDGSLALQTEAPFCRGIEQRLRRTLYAWGHMPADMVVEPYLDLGKVIHGVGFGIGADEERAVTDAANSVVGHAYHDQLRTEADLAKIRMPEVRLDEAATAEREEQARAIFDGVLEVRMQGMTPMFAPWDRLAEWHGVEGCIMDLIDRPEFAHALIGRMTDAYLSMLDQLEAQGLLACPQATIHCAGAWTDELPAPGFDPGRPRARDGWTAGMAQIFSTVSPAMHEEFEVAYAVRWYERFGLGYYGCCEPLDRKIDIIRALPRVRKVSISPWADVERAASQMGGDYVLSRKPNPAFLAAPTWDRSVVEDDLRATLAACQAHGTPVEFILKDISTVCYEPQRLWAWHDIAMRMVEEAAVV